MENTPPYPPYFMRQPLKPLALGLAALVFAAGCTTVKHAAVNKLGDTLAEGGTVFASDDDPELIRAAVPFSLKVMESLLAENPKHSGLLFAAASGFTQYAYAFVQEDAEELEARDVAASIQMRERARRLYLRARDYGLRGLDAAHPGFAARLRADPQAAVSELKKPDVRLSYWTAAAWAAAISVLKNDTGLIADLPIVEALIDRSLVLDEGFDRGAIHGFLISYESARPGASADAEQRARQHFERALALSHGTLAGPFVSLAEAVAVPAQNRAEFDALIEKALAVDPDAHPETRLANLIMQRRARWLRSQADELIAR